MNCLLLKKMKIPFSYLLCWKKCWKEEAIKRIEAFREAFSSFKLQRFTILTVNIDDETASLNFEVNFIGIIEGSNERKKFTGTGSFLLKKEYDFWCIYEINIPGGLL